MPFALLESVVLLGKKCFAHGGKAVDEEAGFEAGAAVLYAWGHVEGIAGFDSAGFVADCEVENAFGHKRGLGMGMGMGVRSHSLIATSEDRLRLPSQCNSGIFILMSQSITKMLPV